MSKPGHPQPERDYGADPELNFFSRPSEGGQKPDAPPASKPEFLPPADQARAIRHSAQEADREWERLDSQGIRTSEQTRKEVGGLALTSEDIENEAIKAAKRQLAQSPPAHRPKKDRRHLSSGQKNMADSDKRVEAAYGKPGEDL